MSIKRYYILLIIFILIATSSFAEDAWRFKLTSETKKLIESPFFLITAVDLNKNGKKEIIAADFGRFGDHIEEWKLWKKLPTPNYNLFLLEWDKSELNLMWKKQWDMTRPMSQEERDKYFLAYEARQFVIWSIGDRVVAETIPPYLGLEWVNGKYLLHEKHGYSGSVVGSWALPWLSPACYPGGPSGGECIAGIRDFSGNGKPKIVTIITEEIAKSKYKQTLRVRGFEPGFPIEWEETSPKRLVWIDPIDHLNWHASSKLLMREFKTISWYLFGPEGVDKGYHLSPIQAKEPMGIVTFDLPDVYLRSTQKKGLEEFWGYHRKELTDPESLNFILLLKRVLLKPDLTGFTQEVIDFPHHENFVGVGYFDLKDLDNDGLDEIILVEETAGKFTPKGESVEFSKIKDYIRILKWDGKEYKTMWVSPPYTKRGTKFLVEDVKNTGKKQLVVMTPYGTIQIWERE